MEPEVKDNGAIAEGIEQGKLQLRVQRIMVEGQKEDLELHSTILKFGNLMPCQISKWLGTCDLYLFQLLPSVM